MTEAHQKNAKIAVLKVSYLLAVTVVVFAMPALSLTRPVRWFVIPTLLGIQVITLLVCRVGLRDTLWSASRLKWLFVFLLPARNVRPASVWVPFGERRAAGLACSRSWLVGSDQCERA